ncbi:hypothetical protein BCR37DRAFT_382921 [Protomyces lactucae-debilis]|uniref:Protoporphyrinogen oxidase n=1 Tax=Protomyces lactucae-debilis TaxID=2754530 RepID=A0A1Y2F1N0_PROLT|nr:uncharacterized protein BCR37DRAFT_382921 [Protomyces lactucae-debilis]ORY77404.1 hypothetical protein BCR37DRAFT_382921 [Protomyces lactucae-debilis]
MLQPRRTCYIAPRYRCTRRYASNKIAVIGGGIAGLSAAYFLQKQLPAAHITLFETAKEAGGWVKSKSLDASTGGNVVFEEGPRSLRPVGLPGLSALDLVRQLELEDKLILVPKSSPSAKNRFIYYKGKVHKLPSSLVGFLKFAMTNPILKGSLGSLMLEPFRKRRPASLQDESIGSFISRRFSPIMANNMLSAVVHGIYSGSVDALSVKSTFGALWKYEGQAGSVVAGILRGTETLSPFDQQLYAKLKLENTEMAEKLKDTSVYSFQGGLMTMTNRLQTLLKESGRVNVEQGAPVRRLEVHGDTVSVTQGGQTISFDKVVSAVNAKQLSSILHGTMETTELDAVEYSTVMVINLYYKDPAILPIDGFGYLIPKSVPLEDNPDRALGVVFDSASVPGQDSALGTKVTCIMGGHWWKGLDPSALPTPEQGLERTKRVMQGHLGVTQEPALWNAKLQHDCIPQYTVGHAARMKKLDERLAGFGGKLGVIGSSYGGVSVNDCILNARKVADAIVAGQDVTGLEAFREAD